MEYRSLKGYTALDNRRQAIVRAVVEGGASFSAACRAAGLNPTRERKNTRLMRVLHKAIVDVPIENIYDKAERIFADEVAANTPTPPPVTTIIPVCRSCGYQQCRCEELRAEAAKAAERTAEEPEEPEPQSEWTTPDGVQHAVIESVAEPRNFDPEPVDTGVWTAGSGMTWESEREDLIRRVRQQRLASMGDRRAQSIGRNWMEGDSDEQNQ